MFFFSSCASGTKQAAHRLKILFGLTGLKAAELHGNLTQAQRLDVRNLDSSAYPSVSLFARADLNRIVLQSLELFRKQEVDFLIATDVAARVSIRNRCHTFQMIPHCSVIFTS